MQLDVTRRAVDFIQNLAFDKLDPAVVRVVKDTACDYLAVALAGTNEPSFNIALAYVSKSQQAGNASVLRTGQRLSAEDAAMVNGIAAHALDYDDVHEEVHGHPSAVLWPVIFAISEQEGGDGVLAIEAFTAAAEFMCKLGGGIDKTHYSRGWHATSTIGTMGAAVASSKLLGLTADQTAQALGLAGSFSGGLRCNFGSMAKCVHAGWAAKCGITAAKLAKEGISASVRVIEATSGFVECFSEEPIQEVAERIDELGEKYSLLTPGPKLKAFPCCAGTHAALGAAQEIYSKYNDSYHLADIIKVICRCKPWQPTVLRYPDPQNGMQAKFSMQYCVAKMLLTGRIDLADFKEDAIFDSQVRQLMSKIEMTAVPLDQYEALPTVEVFYSQGNVVQEKCSYPLGHPKNPLSPQEKVNKFKACTKGILSSFQQEDILEAINSMEQQNNIGQIMRLCVSLKKRKRCSYEEN